ncbi:amino acid/polyamine transporter I [Colletotrichum acutatum]|uniref:Amino acid/polyamine transporter I n=1 Tax=Glomerella acutata TaxID=27357 RepID=A0AAD8U8Y5_GLOAC|nr:amino acid/polyamine transporter I [Colletotrichum acutatum]KAK1702420.1 amino acid/polyamine transporter I [Colletotrichum acutatum]
MTSKSAPEKQSVPTGIGGEFQTQTGYAQEVRRNFSPTAILATCVSLMATWEALCSTMATGLISGGPASLVYGAMIAFIGSLCSAMSLAELASIHPTAGGQYHFVAYLSPGRRGPINSWFAGYITTLGWVALAGSAPFLAGTQIQGLLILNYPDSYTSERWHGTLLYWAILLGSALVCIFCSSILPLLEKITMTLHIAFYLVILIVMAVVSPTKHSASFVFATFENNSGWSNDGIAWCIGLLSCCYVVAGYDGATHLSEEMENAQVGVPRAMVGCVIINGALGFTFLITLLFCMGDIESALNSTTGFPIIQIFYNITGSLAAANALTAAVTIMAIISTIPLITSAARVMWAFARDQGNILGLPFSRVVSKVERKRGIPTTAIVVTTCLLVLLGLINIGSTTAFNAILSLAVVSLQASYLFPIILVLWCRICCPETLVWGPWRLGRAGVAVNVAAVCYLVFTCGFLILPPFQPVNALNMNYAPVVLGAALLFGAFYWLLRARKRYVGPLTELHVVNGCDTV